MILLPSKISKKYCSIKTNDFAIDRSILKATFTRNMVYNCKSVNVQNDKVINQFKIPI